MVSPNTIAPIAFCEDCMSTESPDLIFAAIDAFRRADAACVAADGNVPDELMDRCDAAFDVILRTRPTTPAGLVALTSWARERAEWFKANASVLEGKDHLCRLLVAIDDATKALIGGHA